MKTKKKRRKYSVWMVIVCYSLAVLIIGVFCNGFVPITIEKWGTVAGLFIALLPYGLAAYFAMKETKPVLTSSDIYALLLTLFVVSVILITSFHALLTAFSPCPESRPIPTGLDGCMLSQYFLAILWGYFFGLALYLTGILHRTRKTDAYRNSQSEAA